MELIKKGTRIDFIRLYPYVMVVSAILLAASVYVWFQRGDTKYGIDYVGGHQYVVSFQEPTDSNVVRSHFANEGISVVVQSFEIGSNQYIIRLSTPPELKGSSADEARAVRALVEGILKRKFSSNYEVIQSDYIGPTIGDELKTKALWAITLGLIGILIYITVRFEVAFAVGAITALFHDVIISVGVYLWAGHELNSAALAAVLTIIGYSVNDTIVIFDRVREEIFKRKNFDLRELLNDANNQMLSRTIITSLLTLFSALSLYLFGGGAIADLSLFLVVGVITGSFSTIFIACPIVLIWDNVRQARRARVAAASSAQ